MRQNSSGIPLTRRAAWDGDLQSEKATLALRLALHDSPHQLAEHGKRLTLAEAERVCDALSRRRLPIQPFDFPGTCGVWQSLNSEGIPYTQVATRQFVDALGRYEGVDPRTPEGFKEIIKWFTIDCFRTEEINRHGTTLGGMISSRFYSSSPSRPILELVRNDPDFKVIKMIGLAHWDFPEAPNSLWRTPDGKPTQTAQLATKVLIKSLASLRDVSHRSVAGFREVLQDLHQNTFLSHEINYWGTTLNGMLTHAYGGSPYRAVEHLVTKDPEFRHVQKVGIAPYDLPKSPQNTWIDKQGFPTTWARHATDALLTTLASQMGVNALTHGGFVRVASAMDGSAFRAIAVNPWGTCLPDMLRDAYDGDPLRAIIDLATHTAKYRPFLKDARRLTAA